MDKSNEQTLNELITIVTKAGNRHNSYDKTTLQKIHDLTGDLGAKCYSIFSGGKESACPHCETTVKGFGDNPTTRCTTCGKELV